MTQAGDRGDRGPGGPLDRGTNRALTRPVDHAAAAAFVQALAKAARSFTLYDPANALIRQFLADYQRRGAEATAAGPLAVDVLPFELQVEGDPVYREEDRERSLAFRLFRDGVRKVTFGQGVSFDELAALLRILAVRFTGIRQSEDDVVTLLRGADFRTIELVAVEGYVPDEDLPELKPEGGSPARTAGGARPPAGFDKPFPKLPAPGPIAYQPVPAEALAPLRAAEGPDGLARAAARTAADLIRLASQGMLSAEEAAAFLAEVRDHLVRERQLVALFALADVALAQPEGPLRGALLRAMADARLLEAVLGAVPEGATVLPPRVARLLPFVPAGAVLELLAREAAEGRRAVLVALATARLPADADAVVARLGTLPGAAARALAQVVAARAPEKADAAASALAEHPDPEVQAAGLRALAGAEQRVPSGPLVRLLSSPVEAVRIAAAGALERHGDAAAARAVAAALTERSGYSKAEAEALGRALARVHPGVADRLFDEWLSRRSRLLAALRGDRDRDALRRFAAVAGLGVMSGASAVLRIEEVAEGADEELRRHCQATLARRAKETADG